LFDLENDPNQLNKIDNLDKEVEMLVLLKKLMIESEAPKEQFERLGMYLDRDLTREDLIAQRKERELNEDLKLDKQIKISDKVKKQLNFIKDIIPDEEKNNFIKDIEALCKSRGIQYIDENLVMEIADFSLNKLNLGDKKVMVINLMKFADKVD